MGDWYVIERAVHDGRSWIEPTKYGSSLRLSSRFGDADVEGSAFEMCEIAKAIEQRETVSFKRCSVDASSEPVRFCSPRNSQVDGECSLAEADELVTLIRSKLPG